MDFNAAIIIEWNELEDKYKETYDEDINICDIIPECCELNFLPIFDEEVYEECIEFDDEEGMKTQTTLKKVWAMLATACISDMTTVVIRVDY